MVVGVLEESGEHLHHPGIEPLLVGGQPLPFDDVGIAGGELGPGRHHAELELPLEHLLAVGVPAVVELPLVLVGPGARHVVGRVHRARTEVEEEWLVGRDLLAVGDEPDRPIDQILGEVVALLGRLGGGHLMVVVDEIRVVLVRVTAHEAVEPFEAAAEWPAVVGAGRARLLRRREVPLADRVCVVAVSLQDLGDETVLEGDEAVAARVPGRPFSDARHGVRVVVAPGQDAGAARRAERRGVHVGEAQPIRRQAIEVGRPDRRAVATEMPVPGVVEDDEDDVRHARPRADRLWPGRLRLTDRAADDAWKGRASRVFLDRHVSSSSATQLDVATRRREWAVDGNDPRLQSARNARVSSRAT